MKKRLKVAVVNVFFPPQAIGGATRVLSDNVEILNQEYNEEFELVFYTSDVGQQAPHTIQTYMYKGMRVYRAGIIYRINMDWHPQDAESGKLFKKFLQFEKPDIVHFHCVQRLSASLVEETLNLSIPYIVTIHDAWWISDYQFLVDPTDKVYPEGHPDPFASLKLPSGINLDDSLSRRSYLKSLLNQASYTLIVSKAFAEIYEKNGVQNIQINRNGIQTREWLPRILSKSGKVRLGHIGGMSSHKGYDLLKESIINNGFQNIELIVVDHSKSYEYEYEDYWGTTPVTFIGKTPQASIEELYAKIDVLVAPSIWPESYGLVTREAVAAGCWVIASDIGAIGEDIVEKVNGFKVKAGSLTDLSRVIGQIDNNYKLYSLPPKPVPVRNVAEQVDELVEYYKAAIL